LAERKNRPSPVYKKTISQKTAPGTTTFAAEAGTPVVANVIESPPIDGFIPWIVVTFEYLPSTPQSDYVIGIFDTGATASLVSNDDALKTGIYGHVPDLVTHTSLELIGATGSAYAWASQPLGVFIDSISAIEPNGLLINDTDMVGETNVSILVGDAVESPNLPTAVGSPLAVYFSAAFYNDRQVYTVYDNNVFTAPDIHFYSLSDPCIPTYSNSIDLQLRPTNAVAVQYFPCFELFGTCPPEDADGSPATPTVLMATFDAAQSLYFLPWVNLADGNETVPNQDDFMLDTGAQITVISQTIAAGLRLDQKHPKPEFDAEIQGASGDVIIAPGYYIDSLQIPASGQWLEYTHVPVVVLNVESPEGGYLGGIIGMNLFVNLNFVIRGGGLMGQGYHPSLQFQPICRLAGDIAPETTDCVVDELDLEALTQAWLATLRPFPSTNWNPRADLAPASQPDGNIDFRDFAVLADNWLEHGPTP